MYAIRQIFVVQVRTRGQSGHPHIADDLALLHARAHMDVAREARHVAVERRDIGAVGEDDGIAVAAALARETDVPVAGRVHRRADGRRVVGAHVSSNQIQDRMLAMRVECGTHAGEFERRPQERLAHRQAGRCVVAGMPVRNKTHRAIDLAVVHELGRQHLAIAKILSVLEDLFVHGREAVALADVEHEVDVPGKDIGELQCHRVGDVGRTRRLKQRRIDGGPGRAHPGLHRVIDHLGLEAAVLEHDVEGLRLADLAGEFLDVAISVRELDRIARFQEVQALADARQVADRRQVGFVERHPAKNGIEGIVPADHHFDHGGDAGLLGNDRGRRGLGGGGCRGHIGRLGGCGDRVGGVALAPGHEGRGGQRGAHHQARR